MATYMVNKDGKKYIFTNIDRIRFTKGSPATTISIPGQEKQEVMKMEGINLSLSISWKVKNESMDVSDGTNATPVRTAEEQVIYLLQNFVTAEISLDYEVEVFVETLSGRKFRGVIENISLDQAGGEPYFSGSVSVVVSEIA